MTFFFSNCSDKFTPEQNNNEHEINNDEKDSTDADYFFSPLITIEYTDKKNNNLIKNIDIDKSAIQVIIKDKDIFEVVSITDTYGESFISDEVIMGKGERPLIGFFIFESFSLNSPVIERDYIVKYKIPPILGKNKVEELKITFSVKNKDKFTRISYNNKDLKLVSVRSLIPDTTTNEIDWNEVQRKIDKLLYCGEIVACIEGSSVHIIIPT